MILRQPTDGAWSTASRAMVRLALALAVLVSGAAAEAEEQKPAAAPCRMPENAVIVQNVPEYNSWPMIQAVGNRLICAYSRGSAHTIDEPRRDVFARSSTDGGRTWGREVRVANDPAIGEVTEGAGSDSSGAMLLWVRCWGGNRRHELYRTADGERFERIASIVPDPFPMQITNPLAVPTVGLVSFWFAGEYRKGGANAWGMLVSRDDGHSWSNRVVEGGLTVKEWPTEPSAVYLGAGRILVIARCEQRLGNQFQLTSADYGRTWKRERTNIGDVSESTPALVYDPASGLVSNYYYQRGARRLKRRVAKADHVFAHPAEWPEPVTFAEGFEKRAHDAGNVNVVRVGGTDYCAWYTGSESDTAVVVTVVPAK